MVSVGKAVGRTWLMGSLRFSLPFLHQILHVNLVAYILVLGGQIVQNVFYSPPSLSRLRGAVLVVGIHRTPGVGVHQLAILHHGQLGGGKP